MSPDHGQFATRATAPILCLLFCHWGLLVVTCFPAVATGAAPSAREPLKVLFLGDRGHHRPQERYLQIRSLLGDRGIQLEYTERVTALELTKLRQYDALLLYANIDAIEQPQARALLDYVAQGGGFVPIHCASYCFRNSPEIVGLIGAQFKRHGTGTFRTEIAQPGHPVMRGFEGFESWDETYEHHLHNEQGRTVLAYRAADGRREPWTWVRSHGKGRVFYTAWGHDHRTWGHPGFQNLLERGIRWAAGQPLTDVAEFRSDPPFPNPQIKPLPAGGQPMEFREVGAKIPNYVASERWGVQGKPQTAMQLPLPPAGALQRLAVPEGFRAELFAAEPELGGKPIAMAWDHRGRLWVCETVDYPNQLQPAGKGRDRIRICEDTDGDWRADKFTVFADQLSIPTSLAFWRGGVIVQNGTETLYLKDTDGDDRADQREVLITGWAMGDTHGGVSNFQYGLDNWIWAMQGYNQSRPVIRGQAQPEFRMGFFRFAPDANKLEFIRSTNNNTWGLGFSEEGIVFGSTANRNPSVYMPIANRYYEKVRGWTPSLVLGTIAESHLFQPITKNVRQVDQHGGYTAGAGHALYTARVYPATYWNRTAVVNGPTGHLAGVFGIRPEGSDFRARYLFNLLASDDQWCAPIMSEVGPDGNYWVLDWYNFIVQHNPTPEGFRTGRGNAYETELRDKQRGRIYRLVYVGPDARSEEQPGAGASGRAQAGRAQAGRMTLEAASPEKLVATLTHTNFLWRRHAQRLLVERGKSDVAEALIALVEDQQLDPIGLVPGAIHALWTLHGLGLLDGGHPRVTAAAVAALRHRSAGVRRNAVQVLPPLPTSTQAILDAGVLADRDAQVRLAATLALADLPSVPAAGAALVALATDPRTTNDRWIPDAVTSAAAQHASSFLQRLAQWPDDQDSEIVRLAALTRIISEHQARTSEPGAELETLLTAWRGAPPQLAEAWIDGLAAGWPRGARVELAETADAALEDLAKRVAPGPRGKLVKLAANWGSERLARYAGQIVASLAKQLADEAAPLGDRAAAARQLLDFRGTSADIRAVLEQVTPQAAPELSVALIRSLSFSSADETGAAICQQLANWTPGVRREAISVLLERPRWLAALLAAIEGGNLPLAELSLDQRQVLLTAPDPELRSLAREIMQRGGALPSPDRQRVIEELSEVCEQTGDPAAGKRVFIQHCAKCHRHQSITQGPSQQIGPNLTGMAVHPKRELLAHILDPSRSVEGNYRVYTVVTIDGEVLTGLLAGESRTTVELFDAEGRKRTLLREDVERLVASRKSLMPEGFEKLIQPRQLADLLEFLTQRGRFVPVDLTRAATITSDRGMFFTREGTVERLIFPDWNPKAFAGVPFQLIDPQDGTRPNCILLHGPNGPLSDKMPRRVVLPCNQPVGMIHLLSGVSGWGFPLGEKGSVSMIVRLHYADGSQEDHELLNGIHFADYIRRVDVAQSQFAFALRGQQLRYLAVRPQKPERILKIELLKGADRTAPIVMAVTLESAPGDGGDAGRQPE